MNVGSVANTVKQTGNLADVGRTARISPEGAKLIQIDNPIGTGVRLGVGALAANIVFGIGLGIIALPFIATGAILAND